MSWTQAMAREIFRRGVMKRILVLQLTAAEIPRYVPMAPTKNLPAVSSDELPVEVLKLMADRLIVSNVREGLSEQATQAAVDEFLMSVKAGRLNVPVRRAVQ